MSIDWKKTYAAIWRDYKDCLHPVAQIDPVLVADLLGIDEQKSQLYQNTKHFIQGQTAHHALLWGAKGTGKSSLTKAIFNQFKMQNLRIIEVPQDQLSVLCRIIDTIRLEPYRFILFCDDLSFEAGSAHYKSLKTALDGSIESPAKNVLIYATSNRRHLVAEFLSDNQNVQIQEGELHYPDVVEERLSLADRFGLWLAFYPSNERRYLQMVDHYCQDLSIEKDVLRQKALAFSRSRGGARSGRTAKQFYLNWLSQENIEG